MAVIPSLKSHYNPHTENIPLIKSIKIIEIIQVMIVKALAYFKFCNISIHFMKHNLVYLIELIQSRAII